MNKYSIVLTNKESGLQMEFDFENHDDIFTILEKMKQRFPDEEEAKQFALGIKLFGGVMMKNRGSELFAELEPAFRDFMMKLKGKK